MDALNPRVLDFLHDAVVSKLCLTFDDDERRNIAVTVTGTEDADHPALRRRSLVVHLDDIVVVNLDLFGAITGPETINTWDRRIASSVQPKLAALQRQAADLEGFVVAFNSGSGLVGVCRQLVIEAIP